MIELEAWNTHFQSFATPGEFTTVANARMGFIFYGISSYIIYPKERKMASSLC